jgi:hypothetical protein
MKPRRACRPVHTERYTAIGLKGAVHLLHFDEKQDPDPVPHQCEKSDPDPHQSEKRDPDPHPYQLIAEKKREEKGQRHNFHTEMV